MNRILLLIDQKENRRLLAEWLSRRYEIIPFEQELVAAFDLCIVDGVCLSRLEKEIAARKEADNPFFLPFLLMTPRNDVGMISRHLWRTIDELLLMPIERNELMARVEILLRTRRLSLELGQLTVQLDHELTQRMEAEASLQENRDLLQSIIDSSSALIYVRDLEQRFILVNDCFETVFRMTQDDVVGKTVHDLFPKEVAQPWLESDLKVLQTQSLQEWEETITTDSGPRTYLSMAFPLHNRKGLIYAVCGMSVDVTLLKQAEETLRELNHQKDQFLSIAGHELRTPLTSIKGYAQSLERRLRKQEGELNQTVSPAPDVLTWQFRVLNNMTREINRMNKLVGDMLSISRLQQGQFEMTKKEQVNLCELVQRVVENHQVIAGERRLIFNNGFPPVQGTYDEARLEQVFTNLISNALKFSPPEKPVVVSLEPRPDAEQPKEVVVSVRDEGIGIDKEHQNHIFDRFYKVRTNQEEYIEGLGLGLYISREIVLRHGGQLWFDSTPGEGTTFFVALPLHDSSRSEHAYQEQPQNP